MKPVFLDRFLRYFSVGVGVGGAAMTTCDWGTCERRADSFRFDERLGALVPVCWRHITAYRIGKGGTGPWQAEDEVAGLRFCRRSRWRWLAQRRILVDQRAAMAGRMSRAQARRWKRADA